MYVATIYGKNTPVCDADFPISSQTDPVNKYRICIYKSNADNDFTDTVYTYRRVQQTKRRVEINVVCMYLFKKLIHCTTKKYCRNNCYYITVIANLQWLISVIDVEFDYHLGKKMCTKKCNEKYMTEYMATQLSGYGEMFYDPVNNISNSRIAKLYPMDIKKNKKN